MGDVHPAASIGAALTGGSRGGGLVGVAEDLLHRADLALYRAKAAGANRLEVHWPELGGCALGRPVPERVALPALERRELRRAVDAGDLRRGAQRDQVGHLSVRGQVQHGPGPGTFRKVEKS